MPLSNSINLIFHCQSLTWNIQPIMIIFPSRGSMGRRARIVPRGVNSPFISKASISLRAISASATASRGGGSMALDRKSLISPRRRSLMLRASSRRGVRNISGVAWLSRRS